MKKTGYPNWVAGAALLGMLLGAPSTILAQRLPDSDALGAHDHPVILRQFGGEISDKTLSAYVAGVGKSLVLQTSEAQESWHFTVLDSPVVNAFALPGGYVYVTRGLLAIANNEAELAAVLGHEIGHVTSHHGEERIARNNKAGIGVVIGTILGGVFGGKDGAEDAIKLGLKVASGYMASYSKQQELEADRIAVDLLQKTGYTPMAAAQFLDQLAAKEALEKQVSGEQYNPNRVDFFASHPATGQRIAKARTLAQKSVTQNQKLDEAKYLGHINGLIYGDTAQEGFIRGLTFSHPKMQFTFTVPKGFILENTPQKVLAADGSGARFILDGDAAWEGSLTDYVTKQWVPLIKQESEVSNLRDLRALKINGLQAATAMVDISTKDGPSIAQLTAIRFGDATFRIASVTAKSQGRARNALNTAAQSFRRLTNAEAAQLQPYRLKVVTVAAKDSVASLSRTMPLTGLQQAQFRALNGYRSDSEMKPGDLVKTVE